MNELEKDFLTYIFVLGFEYSFIIYKKSEMALML